MKITEFKKLLSKNPEKILIFTLPNTEKIPAHFHITEVGYVKKRFIDCGGTRRTASACVLQAWVAENDEKHSLIAGKLLSILKLAKEILPEKDIPVEVEFEAPFISQFPVEKAKVVGNAITFQLTTKNTDCLAKEKCGLNPATTCSSAKGGCC